MSSSNKTTETGLQLFNRLHHRPKLENLHSTLFTTGPKPNQIVQITGASGTGKSLLMSELLVHAILPKRLSGEFQECSAFFINTDHQISIIQIVKMTERKLSMLNIPTEEHETIVKASLERLMIFNCFSFQQFRITLLNLEHLLSENLNVALVVIDSLTAYYWCERYNSDTKMLSINKHSVDLLKTIKNVIEDKQIVVVFSKYESDFRLTAMVDYTITLKCNQLNSYWAECYHKSEESIVHSYLIDGMLHFEHSSMNK